MYLELYHLIETLVFGSVVAGSYEALVCTAVASFGVLTLCSLPFIIVWKLIKTFI